MTIPIENRFCTADKHGHHTTLRQDGLPFGGEPVECVKPEGSVGWALGRFGCAEKGSMQSMVPFAGGLDGLKVGGCASWIDVNINF